MSIVYPADAENAALPPVQPPKETVSGFIADHLVLAVIMALIIAIIVGYVINTLRGGTGASGSTASTGTALSASNGSDTATTVYVPTSNMFVNYSNVTGSYNDTSTVTNNDNDQHMPPPPHKPPVTTPPPPVVKPPKPPTRPTPPPPRQTVYTVRSGDWLSTIASRFHTSWQAIFNANRSTIVRDSNAHGNPIAGGPQNNIFPGEQLIIP